MKSHPVNIAIVVDNQAGPGLATEHGLALHIESAGRHILFDTMIWPCGSPRIAAWWCAWAAATRAW